MMFVRSGRMGDVISNRIHTNSIAATGSTIAKIASDTIILVLTVLNPTEAANAAIFARVLARYRTGNTSSGARPSSNGTRASLSRDGVSFRIAAKCPWAFGVWKMNRPPGLSTL